MLPDELILTFRSTYAQETRLAYFWKLVEKTDTTLSFRVQITDSFGGVERWNLLYSPFDPPRTRIDYVLW